MGESELGIYYSATLPLGVEEQAQAPDPGVMAADDHANEQLLKALMAMDERLGDLMEEESAVAQELRRMDQKLNLILDLVAELLREKSGLVPDCLVRLGAQRIKWQQATEYHPGQVLRLRLYLFPHYPRPFTLYARVLDQETREGVSWWQAEHIGLTPAVQDLLEKFIFRQHRRSVAVARAQG